jgi:hypothetical protein
MAAPQDVTIRLYDENLTPLPAKGAVEYLVRLGAEEPRGTLYKRVRAHARHVEAWMRAGAPITAAQVVSGDVVLEPAISRRFTDHLQQGIDVGFAAGRIVEERLPDMADRDVIAVFKTGLTSAAVQANLTLKGAIRKQQEQAKIASGLDIE